MLGVLTGGVLADRLARRYPGGRMMTQALGWLDGGMAPVAIAAASQRFGMSACLSANAAIYLLFGGLLSFGVRAYMRRSA